MLTVYCKFILLEKWCDDSDRLQMALTRSLLHTELSRRDKKSSLHSGCAKDSGQKTPFIPLLKHFDIGKHWEYILSNMFLFYSLSLLSVLSTTLQQGLSVHKGLWLSSTATSF